MISEHGNTQDRETAEEQLLCLGVKGKDLWGHFRTKDGAPRLRRCSFTTDELKKFTGKA